MKTLPLSVLVHEGPQARAYLGCLRRAGFRPERILLMIYGRRAGPGPGAKAKTVGRWLPAGLRRRYCEAAQEASHHHWPRRIARSRPALCEAVSRGLESVLPDAGSLLEEMRGPFAYEEYAHEVERVLVTGLRDPALAAALTASGPGTVLFTGGGLLRRDLLDLPGVRFLHVHPGFLPHVRGADGLLWSLLVRGRPGAACFYMSAGIDTGDLIASEELPPLCLDLGGEPRPDDDTLYRATFSFVDPLLRAAFFAQRVPTAGAELSDLPARPQDASAGVTYHFLHPGLRAAALRRLYPGGSS